MIELEPKVWASSRKASNPILDYQWNTRRIFCWSIYILLLEIAPNCAFFGSIHPRIFWAVPILVERFAVGKRTEKSQSIWRMSGRIVVPCYPVKLAFLRKFCASAKPPSHGNPHLLLFCKVQSWQFQWLWLLHQIGKHSEMKTWFCSNGSEETVINPILLGVKTVLFAQHHVAPE